MIPGSISGQLLIEQEINRLDTAARSSLVYPIDEVSALSIGVELVESRIETVFRPVYFLAPQNECTSITSLTATINLRSVPVLPIEREATVVSSLTAVVNLKDVPLILPPKESVEISNISVVSYRLAGISLETLADCTSTSALSVTIVELENV